VSKATKKQRVAGATTRTVVCSFCGEPHRRRSRELDECRARHRDGKPSPEPFARATAEPRRGTPTTRYDTDPLRGNKRAHSIARKHREGMDDRKIAKSLNVSLAEVRDVLRVIA
jgi:hypothetical protein